jgi:hypothetical protein
MFVSRDETWLSTVRTVWEPSLELAAANTPSDPLARATSALSIVRDGGVCLTDDDACAPLRDAGCVDVDRLDHGRPVPLSLFGGKNPD